MTDLILKLAKIQSEITAPKGQWNKFGGYYYRNCEDILQAVKPLLDGLLITVNDEMVLIGDRFYVKATATITDGKDSISTSAYAREELNKKGMDASQITGSTSSYARKYALNGLLLIDDNKDADATNQHGREQPQNAQQGSQQQSPRQEQPLDIGKATAAILNAKNQKQIQSYLKNAMERGADQQQMQQLQNAANTRNQQLQEPA